MALRDTTNHEAAAAAAAGGGLLQSLTGRSRAALKQWEQHRATERNTKRNRTPSPILDAPAAYTPVRRPPRASPGGEGGRREALDELAAGSDHDDAAATPPPPVREKKNVSWSATTTVVRVDQLDVTRPVPMSQRRALAGDAPLAAPSPARSPPGSPSDPSPAPPSLGHAPDAAAAPGHARPAVPRSSSFPTRLGSFDSPPLRPALVKTGTWPPPSANAAAAASPAYGALRRLRESLRRVSSFPSHSSARVGTLDARRARPGPDAASAARPSPPPPQTQQEAPRRKGSGGAFKATNSPSRARPVSYGGGSWLLRRAPAAPSARIPT